MFNFLNSKIFEIVVFWELIFGVCLLFVFCDLLNCYFAFCLNSLILKYNFVICRVVSK